MNALPPEFESFLRPKADDPSQANPSQANPSGSTPGTTDEPADQTAVLGDQTQVIGDADPTAARPAVIPVIPAPAHSAPAHTRQRAVVPQPTPQSTPQPSRSTAAPVVPPPPPRAPAGSPVQPSRRTTTGKRRRRHWFRWIALALVVYVLSLFAVFALSVNRIDAMPPVSSASSSGKNVLIVGSDSRAGLSEEQQSELSTGSVEGDRTDTIMLLHIPTFGTPTLVSIPRDSWVPIPGFGSAKINAAYALGGPELLITTVEQATGLQITDFVSVGFAGVANTTNALGGVTLCPVQDFNDELSGLNVAAGCQTMDGTTALAYVRMRYQDPRGDLGRIERQQEFVAAVGKKTLSPLTWLLPWRAYATAHAAGDALTVSRGTNILDIGRIGVAMGMISLGWGTSTTVPTAEESLEIDGQSALQWQSDQARTLFAELE